MRITLPDSRQGGKRAWIATITGTDPEYRFQRSFIRGMPGRDEVSFDLDESTRHAFFEVCCPDRDERYFGWFRRGGEFQVMSSGEAQEYAKDLQERIDEQRSRERMREFMARIADYRGFEAEIA
jgi:hypothetical protein